MAKKPLRAIAEKGDKKLLSDKLKGVNKSTTEPLDLEDLVMSPEGNKATVDFGKKYNKIQKHDDRVGNTDVPYKSKGKEAPYPSADAKMYEAADCSCDDDKDSCAVHGKHAGKKLLLGGKKSMKENVEFSTLDTTPGLVPAGMQSVAKNLWNKADNHLTGPTVATGQGRPFIAKLGDEIRQIQKEAVENLKELSSATKASAAMSESHGVYLQGGSIGQKKGPDYHPRHGELIKTFENPEEAKEHAKKRNSDLTAGEKKYYRMKYHVKPINEEHKSMEGETLKPGDQVGYKEGHEKYGHIHSISNDGHAKIKIWNDNTGSHDHVTKHVSRLWKEETIDEVAPPSKNSEEWIKKNKSRFTKEYGKDKGERVLYGKAWNDYKEKH